MVRFLQQRKFRLVIRWKLALKQYIGSRLPLSGPFPYTLVFRTFDELVALVKDGERPTRPETSKSLLASLADAALPVTDHYMEMFLTGRDVLREFVANDTAFCARFPPGDRNEFWMELERALRRLVDREMTEHLRRFSPESARGQLEGMAWHHA